ncbi:MCE family protein [Skermania sp. ID1734]|uniref:MCE family protein n=1 Tax=Skermania sp. ID1734 TaxID=2597516 RepID=UPI001180D13A|nr:MCE family protein [Skermania sp. ID1734]TSD95089.1 MCE family protein [Skermania sp. ID1734]
MERRRSPAMIGFLSIFIVLLITISAFFISELPIIGAGAQYKAQFSEAAGLKKGNEVRIAGVKVGKVTDVSLDGNKVIVAFRTKNAWVGNDTTASIQIKTLLGKKYLALDPQGDKMLDPTQVIPLSRTTSPYDVIEAFSDLAKTTGEIDTNQLAQSFEVLDQAMAGTPPEIRSAIDGVARLSDTLAKRDTQLKKLFAATKTTSKILSDRNDDFQKLLSRGGELLAELNFRQQAIHQLLTTSQTLSTELTAFVHDNEAQIGPTLVNLQAAVDLLNKNEQNLNKTLELAAPFYGVYADVLGTGRWFDVVVTNLTPPGLPAIPGYRDPIRKFGQ